MACQMQPVQPALNMLYLLSRANLQRPQQLRLPSAQGLAASKTAWESALHAAVSQPERRRHAR